MPRDRRTYSKAEEVYLLSQVEGMCPLCGERLFYDKNGREYKDYELAHIYPLNPRPGEVAELEGVQLLSEDVNDTANILPLCRGCHGKFDKPRSRDEYAKLVKEKRSAVRRIEQREIQNQYPIESEIEQILIGLQSDAIGGESIDLNYDVKRVAAKLADESQALLRRKVTHCVQDYHSHISRQLKEIERDNPSSSSLICSQVRTYYLKQRALNLSQAEVFENIVCWILSPAVNASRESGEAVVSYFIQNCEVFE